MEENKETSVIPAPSIGIKPMAQIAAAFAAAQGEFVPIAKNRTAKITPTKREDGTYTQGYSYRYADLEGIYAATIPALSKHGIGLTANARMEVLHVYVQPVLIHSSGETMEGVELFHKLKLNKYGDYDIKAMGGILTFLTRYAVKLLLGVEPDDDAVEESGEGVEPEKDEVAEDAAEVKRKFDADPKNQPYRADPPPPPAAADGGITAAQITTLKKAAALPNFAPNKETLIGMIKTLTSRDAEILIASLRGETGKDSPKAKLRGMVDRLGDGYAVDELKFAALDATAVQEWIENFDPMDCPFINVKQNVELEDK